MQIIEISCLEKGLIIQQQSRGLEIEKLSKNVLINRYNGLTNAL